MTVRPLRIVFAGTPEFVIHLRGLIAGPHTMVAVLSQPDRHSGRGKKITPSPVTATARAEGIKVLQPASLRDDDSQEALAQYQADVIVVVLLASFSPVVC